MQYVLYITRFLSKCCKLMYIIIMFIIYNNTTNKMHKNLLEMVVYTAICSVSQPIVWSSSARQKNEG